jgi:hypothetical protein
MQDDDSDDGITSDTNVGDEEAQAADDEDISLEEEVEEEEEDEAPYDSYDDQDNA